MAEPPAQHEEHDEPDETPGYVPPAEKKLDDIVNQDTDDPALEKYKKALLGEGLGKGACPCKFVAYSSSNLLFVDSVRTDSNRILDVQCTPLFIDETVDKCCLSFSP